MRPRVELLTNREVCILIYACASPGLIWKTFPMIVSFTGHLVHFLRAEAGKPQSGETSDERHLRLAAYVHQLQASTRDEMTGQVKDETRRQRFTEWTWRLDRLPLTDVGPWPRMGGLPADWTKGSVLDTAQLIRTHGCPRTAERLAHLIAAIDTTNLHELEDVPLLACPSGELFPTNPRRVPWTLDDGSHRAVLLALHGRTTIHTWIGMP